MKIEFVTHCWKYSRLFAYQLSSFYLNAHPRITATLFYSEEDEETADLVNYFTKLPAPPLFWNPKPLSRERLCRRAIGRNTAALATEADWVWFADCDYWFGPKLFRALPAVLDGVPSDRVLVYPGTIQQCSQEHGDQLIDLVTGPNLYTLPCSCDFVKHGFRKAIGGVQIVRGDWARANGYCKNHPRHHAPCSRWARNVEDVTFRVDTGGSGFRTELPDIYRIRHSRRGGYGPDTLN